MAGRDSSKRKRDAEVHEGQGKTVWQALREAQRLCGCTKRTLLTVFEAVKPFLKKTAATSSNGDEDLHERGNAVVLQLHGCVNCDKFVFLPTNLSLHCPKCGHPRFNRKKKPNEVTSCLHVCEVRLLIILNIVCCCVHVVQVFWYFPLKPQLKSLLRSDRFRFLLMHETRRHKNKKFLSDIYDTPRWHKVAGEPGSQLKRIVYQLCIDAFPWTGRKHAVMNAFIDLLMLSSIFEYICILTVKNLNIFAS